MSGFVTRFGGRCIIDSTPGSGTTVKLYLPRYFGGPEGRDAHTAIGAGADENGKTPVPATGEAGGHAEREAAEREAKA